MINWLIITELRGLTAGWWLVNDCVFFNEEANGIYENATVADSALTTEVGLFPFRIAKFLILWNLHTLEQQSRCIPERSAALNSRRATEQRAVTKFP